MSILCSCHQEKYICFKKKMIFWVFLLCLTANRSEAIREGNCDLENVTEVQWLTYYTNDKVDENVSTAFKTFQISNVANVEIRENDHKKYVNIAFTETNLTIYPTEEFKTYEENENNDENPQLTINLDFKCTSGIADLSFYQPINDINTHSPLFEESSYSYKLPMPLPSDVDLQCITQSLIVVCDKDIANTKLNFDINPPEDFSITYGGPTNDSKKCHSAIIKTKKPISLTTTTDYELTVTDIGVPTKNSSVKMTIQIDEESAIPQNPQFGFAYYTATYSANNEKHEVKFDSTITLLNKNSETTVVLTGEYNNYFDVQILENVVEVTLKENLDEDVINKEVVVLLTIEATVPEAAGPGKTAIVIYMPEKECAPTTTPSCPTITPMECPTATSTIVTCPPCITEAPNCPTTECLLECPTENTNIVTCPPCTTETSSCPTTECLLECPTENTNIITCPPCTTETSSCPTIECPTESTNIVTCPPYTTETSSCPTTECLLECPTESTNIVTCPPCTTETSTLPTEPRVIFLQDLYSFRAVSGSNTIVGAVKAVAFPEEDIEYSIKDDGENTVPNELTIDKSQGTISLNGKISVGLYYILAHAKGKLSDAENITHVQIDIYEIIKTAEVLLVETIKENVESEIQLPCPNGKTTCKYELLDQYPPTTRPLFEYDNGHLFSQSITLQMEELKYLANPQFTLSLKLIENEMRKTVRFNKSIDQADARHWLYLPESIPRNDDILLVSVIVKDVNDHEPVFDEGDSLIVGYPDKNLLNALTPPYLVQVHATDLDRGENADIRYTTTDSDFIVNPKTGIVHPKENIFNEKRSKTFSVIATDNDGADYGKSSELTIQIQLLTESHVTVLIIENKQLEDIEVVLTELSEKTNLNINYLSASVAHKKEPTFFKNLFKIFKNDENYVIKLVIYAIDDSNEPIQAELLQKKLEDIESVNNIITTSWKPTYFVNEEEANLTGYIVAVAILASLLIILLIIMGVAYYKNFYKKRNQMYDSSSAILPESVGIDQHQINDFEIADEIPKHVSTEIVNSVNTSDNEKYKNTSNGERENNNILPPYSDFIQNGNTFSDDSKQIEITNMGYDEIKEDSDSSDYENSFKKSVSFKPIVEKINIVVDDDRESNNGTNT